MTALTIITASPATQGPAVPARFLKVGEQIKVGAVLTVREVLVAESVEPGLVFVLCDDAEGQDVHVRVPNGGMVELYDAVAADVVMHEALRNLGIA